VEPSRQRLLGIEPLSTHGVGVVRRHDLDVHHDAEAIWAGAEQALCVEPSYRSFHGTQPDLVFRGPGLLRSRDVQQGPLREQLPDLREVLVAVQQEWRVGIGPFERLARGVIGAN